MMNKKKKAQSVTLAATVFAVELSDCYSDKELNRIKLFLYQVIYSLNAIQGIALTLDDSDDKPPK